MYAVEDGIYHAPSSKMLLILFKKYENIRRFCNKWQKKYSLWRLSCVMQTSL